MITSRLGWLRVAAGVTGVGLGLVGGSVAWAVDGPVSTDPGLRVVAQVETDGRACSGVLVDPRWVLTLASCVNTGDDGVVVGGVPPVPVWVTVGALDVRQSGRVKAVEVAPHPDRGVVLLRLPAAVGGEVAPVTVGGAPVVGESVTVAGFGRTASEWVPDQVHTTGMSVGAATATNLSLTGDNGLVCKGDAGAPVLRAATGGRWELVGVIDRAAQGGCLDSVESRRGAVGVRADGLAGWVRRHTAVPLPTSEVSRNLLRDASVTVSSSVENWGWFRTQVNDGLREANGWSSSGSDTVDHSEWVQFDFPNGQARSMNRVDLYPRVDAPNTGANFPADFTIEAWVNNAWQVVVTKAAYPKPSSGQKFRFPTVSASKLRVVGTKLRSMQFDEVEAYDSPNLAADATVSASSSAENWGWFVTHTNDGIRDADGWTSWPSQTAAHTEWVQLVFPNNESRRIDRVDLFARVEPDYLGLNFPKDFTIDVWVDNAWRTVVSRTGYPNPGNQAARFAFDPVSTSKVRIQATVTDVMQLNEVEVYDIAPPVPSVPTQVLPDWPTSSAIEDGAYPGAAAIEAAQQIRLISGDGHIVIADCASPVVADVGVIRVRTTELIGPNGKGLVCFKVSGAPGVLNLKVPAVYEIRGDGRKAGVGHAVTAEVSTDAGVHKTVAVDPSGPTQVGIGADPNGVPTTLLQLKVPG